MPFDDIVTVLINDHTVAAHTNIHSVGAGYITFVCVEYDQNQTQDDLNNNNEIDWDQDQSDNQSEDQDSDHYTNASYSSEAKIAKLYT